MGYVLYTDVMIIFCICHAESTEIGNLCTVGVTC